MVIVKRSCKDVDINVRHSISLTGNDRHKMRVIRSVLHQLYILQLEYVDNNDMIGVGIVRNFILAALVRYDAVASIAAAHPITYHGNCYLFNNPNIQTGMLAATYKFKNIDQMEQLRAGLQIPEWLVNGKNCCRYNGQELLLIVLERCALGTRLGDLQIKYDRNHALIGKAITFFCTWMQEHWGYLLHDHLAF
jgi:hypothetical protein